MNIIINGDDLGYSGKENAAIFSYLDKRYITSSTLMVNAPGFDEAVQGILLRQTNKKVSFGVHLNLTEFKPLTQSDIWQETNLFTYPLPKSASYFDGFSSKRGRALGRKGRVLRHACLKEWEEQISKVLDNGITISHIDSHHHIHMLPFLFPILPVLIKKFHIKNMRIIQNIFRAPIKPSIKSYIFIKGWISYFRFLGLRTSDFFCGFEDFVVNTKKALPNNTTIELMTHPGKEWTKKESEILESDWINNLSYPAKLISYNEI
ncbi:carbohydrate deacetylase [Spirochaetia bacterium]|nr:carbohydrate deacetylase [Spirochaetia bacterium]